MTLRGAWLVAALLCVAAAPAPWPAAVQAQLAAEGPKRTVAALSVGRGDAWEAVLRRTRRGDPRWLRLVPPLAEGADAGASEALHAGLSDALAAAPAQVLALTPEVVPLNRLRSVSLIEPTATQVARYRAARLAALSHVGGPSRAKAQACLRLLTR